MCLCFTRERQRFKEDICIYVFNKYMKIYIITSESHETCQECLKQDSSQKKKTNKKSYFAYKYMKNIE